MRLKAGDGRGGKFDDCSHYSEESARHSRLSELPRDHLDPILIKSSIIRRRDRNQLLFSSRRRKHPLQKKPEKLHSPEDRSPRRRIQTSHMKTSSRISTTRWLFVSKKTPKREQNAKSKAKQIQKSKPKTKTKTKAKTRNQKKDISSAPPSLSHITKTDSKSTNMGGGGKKNCTDHSSHPLSNERSLPINKPNR